MIGVLMAEDDRVDVAERGVTLEVRQRSRAGVDPEPGAGALDEIARAGVVGRGVGAATAEDGQRRLRSPQVGDASVEIDAIAFRS